MWINRRRTRWLKRKRGEKRRRKGTVKNYVRRKTRVKLFSVNESILQFFSPNCHSLFSSSSVCSPLLKPSTCLVQRGRPTDDWGCGLLEDGTSPRSKDQLKASCEQAEELRTSWGPWRDRSLRTSLDFKLLTVLDPNYFRNMHYKKNNVIPAVWSAK